MRYLWASFLYCTNTNHSLKPETWLLTRKVCSGCHSSQRTQLRQWCLVWWHPTTKGLHVSAKESLYVPQITMKPCLDANYPKSNHIFHQDGTWSHKKTVIKNGQQPLQLLVLPSSNLMFFNLIVLVNLESIVLKTAMATLTTWSPRSTRSLQLCLSTMLSRCTEPSGTGWTSLYSQTGNMLSNKLTISVNYHINFGTWFSVVFLIELEFVS